MKKNIKDNKKLNNMAIFVIVIIIMFMSIICIELITIIYTEKINTESLGKMKTQTIKKKTTYDTSNLDFTDLTLKEDETYINTVCSDGCNIRIKMYNMDYEYIIKKVGTEYILNVVKDNNLLLSDKNLGTSIENAYFKNYLNCILFYNIISDGDYEYDYATVVDNRSSLDEFSSISYHEFEFTQEGIIYYYDVCEQNIETGNNAKRVKAIRLPFSITPKVLNTELTDYTWCN